MNIVEHHLRAEFYKATTVLSLPIIMKEHDKVVDAYVEPWRVYHGVQHIEEMCELYVAVRDEVGWDKPKGVACAVVYHDFVCVPGHPENEAWSACQARSSLEASLSVGEPVDIDAVYAMIMATRDPYGEYDDRDTRYFLDMDMAILGAKPERYAEYMEQIRQEYAHVREFEVGREAFLQRIYGLARIFKTPLFYERYEGQAQENITLELRGYAR